MNHREVTSTAALSQPRHMFGNSLARSAAALCAALSFGAFAADNAALVAKAKEEGSKGKFLVMVSSPKGEGAQRALMEAFQKRFDMKLDWEWLPLNSGVSAPRMLEQAKANVRLPSAIGGYPYTVYESWIAKNGLDAQVDWVGDFSGMFPSIKAAAVDGVLPKYQKRMLRQWDVQYVMVYNTKQVKRADVPVSIEALTQAQWKGRFAMSNNNAAPLEFIALEKGEAAVADLARRLVDNQPRFKAGPPAVVGAIATGEVAVGVAGYTALAEAQKAKGAPVDWAPLETLPIQPLLSFMLKDAPQPTLGKLFLAWLSTEGLAIQEKEEFLSFYSNKESPTTRAIQAARPNIKVLEVSNDKDLETATRAEAEVMKVISGAVGK